jgi:hypothetical protein
MRSPATSTLSNPLNNALGVVLGYQLLLEARESITWGNLSKASAEVRDAGGILLSSIDATDRMGRHEARRALRLVIQDSVDAGVEWGQEEGLTMIDAIEALG